MPPFSSEKYEIQVLATDLKFHKAICMVLEAQSLLVGTTSPRFLFFIMQKECSRKYSVNSQMPNFMLNLKQQLYSEGYTASHCPHRFAALRFLPGVSEPLNI